MNWSIIQSKKEHDRALARIESLSQIPPSSQSEEGRELMLLGYLVNQYEENEFPISHPDPIDAIKVRMEELGLRVSDLSDVFGDRGTASKVLSKQRALSISMIRALSGRLSLPAELLLQPISPKKYAVKKSRVASLNERKPAFKKKKKK